MHETGCIEAPLGAIEVKKQIEASMPIGVIRQGRDVTSILADRF
jgi:hypothetical protein